MLEFKDKPFIVRDEIHGDLAFDSVVNSVIDHESFQRLRYIKQLGLAEYVFPCANHSRFQHSLGAAYLAGQYFVGMTQSWLGSSLEIAEKEGTAKVLVKKTREIIDAVWSNSECRYYWWQIVTLAALLHDVGHGPWSHTFESLEFKQKFNEDVFHLSGIVKDYLESLTTTDRKWYHEDIGVLYIFQILNDLSKARVIPDLAKYFLPIALLVNPKLLRDPFYDSAERELEKTLQSHRIVGGVAFHRLLRPIISGPFDVDRMDYIQRDGRNCGVYIGNIEWRRIVNKVLPCLAEYSGSTGEPKDVVLISSIKNQHVLDDFIFSLFQMYTQVYLHPKIVGMEEGIKKILASHRERQENLRIDFRIHQSLTDEGLRDFFRNQLGLKAIDQVLLRKPEAAFEVVSLPEEPGIEEALVEQGYHLVENLDRPMMKDSIGVFLYDLYSGTGKGTTGLFRQWPKVSPIAQHFYAISYSPTVWIRPRIDAK